MGKIDNWVTKIPRLKNSKVARFSYKAEAYANDDIEGVENYDYSRDMNVPLATHTDFDSSMLSIGARANFSSIPKNGLNHFFGRVSYNLNKVIDFISDLLDDFRVQGVETIRKSTNFTLGTYTDGKKIRIANTHASNTITCTLPSGQTMNGEGTISIPAGRIIDIELIGSTWKDNLTGNLIGNADTATLATQALAIKPLDNSITLPATPTSETRIIKIATVSVLYMGLLNIISYGNNIRDGIKVYISGGNSLVTNGIRVTYGKVGIASGIKKIIVTRDREAWDSDRNIYAEISTFPNGNSTTTLGVVETNRGTFTPSMTEVSSVEGTVVDSLPLDYVRGDISSYQHEFTKPIIGNLTGNADTADKWKTARNITISDADGTNTGSAVSVDGSENETLKLPSTIKANVTGKANVRVSLRHGDTWFSKTWTGLTDFDGDYIWTDGDNIYCSEGTNQFVLNKATSTWTAKTWTGLTSFGGDYIWTDGDNIYCSEGTNQFVLNKATSTWTAKTWTGLTSFGGASIWTDGENIYYSRGTNHSVLNKATSTWTAKTWTGLTSFGGASIWTDGENIYYSRGTNHSVLNKATSTWVAKTWTGLTNFDGNRVWTDGENIYYSSGTNQFVLNKATSTWVAKTWTGLTNFSGINNWTDGENIYYSEGTTQYVLPATRHNYIDDDKYNSIFGIVTNCNCSTLSARFVFGNE